MDDLGNLPKLGQRLLHERGPSASDEAVEGIADVGGTPLPYDGAGDMRPPDGPATRLPEDVVELEVHPEASEPGHHLTPAPDPIRPAPLEKRLERRLLRGKEITEDMHLAPGRGGRELASPHHAEPQSLARGDGRGYAGYRIVVGEGDGVETGLERALHHYFGRKTPVGSGGVRMKVDRRAGGRGMRVVQRRYPISGAVQEGCECASSARNSGSLNSCRESSRLFEPSGE